MDEISNIMRDFIKSGNLTKDMAAEVESLVDKYRLPKLETGTSIIHADFGKLGSLVIRDVVGVDDPIEFKYVPREYDYISIESDCTTRILWTDYQDIEPYNRNAGLYCDGASFEMLGEPVVTAPDYREFSVKNRYHSNISFAVWGFSYNDFYGAVTFGICIDKNKVSEFISELRKIIGK